MKKKNFLFSFVILMLALFLGYKVATAHTQKIEATATIKFYCSVDEWKNDIPCYSEQKAYIDSTNHNYSIPNYNVFFTNPSTYDGLLGWEFENNEFNNFYELGASGTAILPNVASNENRTLYFYPVYKFSTSIWEIEKLNYFYEQELMVIKPMSVIRYDISWEFNGRSGIDINIDNFTNSSSYPHLQDVYPLTYFSDSKDVDSLTKAYPTSCISTTTWDDPTVMVYPEAGAQYYFFIVNFSPIELTMSLEIDAVTMVGHGNGEDNYVSISGTSYTILGDYIYLDSYCTYKIGIDIYGPYGYYKFTPSVTGDIIFFITDNYGITYWGGYSTSIIEGYSGNSMWSDSNSSYDGSLTGILSYNEYIIDYYYEEIPSVSIYFDGSSSYYLWVIPNNNAPSWGLYFNFDVEYMGYDYTEFNKLSLLTEEYRFNNINGVTYKGMKYAETDLGIMLMPTYVISDYSSFEVLNVDLSYPSMEYTLVYYSTRSEENNLIHFNNSLNNPLHTFSYGYHFGDEYSAYMASYGIRSNKPIFIIGYNDSAVEVNSIIMLYVDIDGPYIIDESGIYRINGTGSGTGYYADNNHDALISFDISSEKQKIFEPYVDYDHGGSRLYLDYHQKYYLSEICNGSCTVYVNDTWGGYYYKHYEVVNSTPYISLTNIPYVNGYRYISGNTAINITDSLSIDSIWVEKEGNSRKKVFDSNGATRLAYSLTIDRSTCGIYCTIYAYAVGGVNYSTQTFHFDSTAPSQNVSGAYKDSYYFKSITLNFFDLESGFDYYKIGESGSHVSASSLILTSNATIYACDKVGNCSNKTWIMDNTAPLIETTENLVTLGNTYYFNNSTTIQSSDAGSGVAYFIVDNNIIENTSNSAFFTYTMSDSHVVQACDKLGICSAVYTFVIIDNSDIANNATPSGSNSYVSVTIDVSPALIYSANYYSYIKFVAYASGTPAANLSSYGHIQKINIVNNDDTLTLVIETAHGQSGTRNISYEFCSNTSCSEHSEIYTFSNIEIQTATPLSEYTDLHVNDYIPTNILLTAVPSNNSNSKILIPLILGFSAIIAIFYIVILKKNKKIMN